MSTFVIRVTSTATNVAGTAYVQSGQPDLNSPSFLDLIVTNSSDPLIPNGVYDAYCLNPGETIYVSPTTYSAQDYAGNTPSSFANVGISSMTQTQVDELNWLLEQNFTANTQYNFGEVQAAIWKIVGYTDAQIAATNQHFLTNDGAFVVDPTVVNSFVAQAAAAVASGNGVPHSDAFFSAVINPGNGVQPLIVQLQGAVSGYVYVDGNNNGLKDAGETPLVGVTLTLNGTNIQGVITPITVTTATDGSYHFLDLLPGTYTVTETQPTGYGDGLDAKNNVPIPGSIGTDIVSGIGVVAGVTSANNNFGETTGSLAGDVTANGSALANVLLTLVDSNGNTVGTTHTDSNGNYSFTGLLGGNYQIVETQPTGYGQGADTVGSPETNGSVTQTATSDTMSLTLGAGVNGTGNNFVETTGSLAGDVTANGSALANVLLTLVDSNGNTVGTTHTDSNGNYSFTGLLGGNYQIVETQPTGYGQGADTVGSPETNGSVTQTATSDTMSLTLGAGINGTGNNFVETTGSLAGDVTANGSALANVLLTLVDSNGNTVGTTHTDSNGNYSFTGLLGGNYQIVETQPTGYGQGADTVGSPETNGSVTQTATSDTMSLTLGAGVNGTGNNFVETTGSLAGDVTANGSALANVLLTLVDSNGNTVGTTHTDSNGNYSFTGLLGGNYQIVETQPTGYGQGADTVGSPETNGSVTQTATSDTMSLTLGAGVNGTGNNFGETLGSLAGDVTANGSALANVLLTLVDSNGNTVGTTHTDSNGNYSFTGLLGGNYQIVETQPTGYGQGADTVGSPETNGSVIQTATSDTMSLTLGAGVNGTGNNFVETTGSLAGDVTANGSALANVLLTLVDSNGNTVGTTHTDSNGNYSFTGLLGGNYQIVETQPTGYGQGADTVGSPETNGSVTQTATSDTMSLTLGAGVNGTGNNFVETTGSLAGDVTANGSALANVLLTLVDSNGNTVGTTHTDSNGNYSFTGLLGGNYQIVETQPTGYGQGADTVGSPETNGSVTQTATSDTMSLTLGAGVNGTGNNFVETTGSLAGDVTANGSALANVLLTLVDSNGNTVGTTHTDSNGNYSFTGLLGGNYVITETQPKGYGEGADTLGNQGGSLGAQDVINATLAAGQAGTGNNFGETLGSLAGTVYVDANHSGGYLTGDTLLSGVTLTLTGTDVNGNAVTETTTTNSNGQYSFANLLAGTYTVTETQPTGYGEGKDTLGTYTVGSGSVTNETGSIATQDQTQVNLVAGAAGVNNNFGETLGSLAGLVYVDANNSGSYVSGDTLLSGVTLTLSENGTVVATTTTNSNGQYSFGNLLAGTYTVTETQPTGYGEGKDTLGTYTVGSGSVTNETGSIATQDQTQVNLVAGAAGVNNNFGETLLAPADVTVVKTADASTVVGGQTIGFDVTITNTGGVTATGVTLHDLLPKGAGGDILWSIDPSQGIPSDFQITGTQGSQSLSLSSPLSLAGGQSITVHITSPTDGADATTISTQPAAPGFDTTGTTAASIISLGMANTTYNANGYDVLGLANTQINNSLVTIHGNEGVSAGGNLTNMAPSMITGNAYESTSGQYSGPGILDGSAIVNSAQLTGNDANALMASSVAKGLSADFTSGSITTTTTFTATTASRADGVTVVDINGGITLNNGSLILSGSASDVFVVNVTGSANFVGTGGLELAGGLTANHVLYNFTGSSGSITSHVGNDFYGTLLAPNYSLNLDGSFYGEIIGGGSSCGASISLLSGTTVNTGSLLSNTATVNASNDSNPNDNTSTATISVVPSMSVPVGSLSGFVDVGISGGSSGGGCGTGGGTGTGTSSTGLSGVTLTLDNSAGVVVATTTTAADGSYLFSNLAAGNYKIIETQPTGYGQGTDTVGSLETNGSVTQTATSDVMSLTLGAGVNGTGNNFNETLAALAGTVYMDSNHSGSLNTGDTLLSGVTLTLENTNGSAVHDATGNLVAAVTTDSSGNYSFSNLLAGSYQIIETPPANYTNGTNTVGTEGGTLSGTHIIDATLGAGVNGTGNNFGELTAAKLGSLSGTVYVDCNDSGSLNTGDTGLSGITVTLDNSAGVAVATTTTGANGSYSFSNLAAGSYQIVETQPAGYSNGTNTVGTEGGSLSTTALNTIDATLAAGVNGTGNNFGELPVTGSGCESTAYWQANTQAWNGVGSGDICYAVKGASTGSLLIGDWNFSGTGTGENTICISNAQAQQILNSTSTDQRYTVEKSLITAWLNVLYGNSDAQVKTDINNAITWLENNTANGSGICTTDTSKAVSTTSIDWSTVAGTTPDTTHSGCYYGAAINNALSCYNNTGAGIAHDAGGVVVANDLVTLVGIQQQYQANFLCH